MKPKVKTEEIMGYFLEKHGMVTCRQIGDHFGIHESTVSRRLKAMKIVPTRKRYRGGDQGVTPHQKDKRIQTFALIAMGLNLSQIEYLTGVRSELAKGWIEDLLLKVCELGNPEKMIVIRFEIVDLSASIDLKYGLGVGKDLECSILFTDKHPTTVKGFLRRFSYVPSDSAKLLQGELKKVLNRQVKLRRGVLQVPDKDGNPFWIEVKSIKREGGRYAYLATVRQK